MITVLQGKIHIVDQPAVEMHFLPKMGEPMIGQYQIPILARPSLDTSTDIANELVEPPVPILYNIHSVMKEHMLDAIQVIEDRGKHALPEIIHQVVENLDPSFEDGLAEIKELIISNATILQPGRILGPAEREIRPHIFPQLLRESG